MKTNGVQFMARFLSASVYRAFCLLALIVATPLGILSCCLYWSCLSAHMLQIFVPLGKWPQNCSSLPNGQLHWQLSLEQTHSTFTNAVFLILSHSDSCPRSLDGLCRVSSSSLDLTSWKYFQLSVPLKAFELNGVSSWARNPGSLLSVLYRFSLSLQGKSLGAAVQR